MCGRFALTAAPQVLRALFLYPEQPNFPPRYNIAPTQPVPVVTAGPQGRAFTLMRWGFLPGFVKDPKDFPLVINIRSETAAEKPSFRNALKRRRALMPADAFYEWHREGRTSTPYLVQAADHGPFAFAALHETWSSSDGSEVDTVALLNTHATGVLATIHPRSPVILSPSIFDQWLDPDTPADEARALLVPPPDDLLVMRPIGTAVNAVRNDGPSLWDPPDDAPPQAPIRRKASSGGSDQGSLF